MTRSAPVTTDLDPATACAPRHSVQRLVRPSLLVTVCHVGDVIARGLFVWKQNARRSLLRAEIYRPSLARCTAQQGSPTRDACRTRWHTQDSLDSDERLSDGRSRDGHLRSLNTVF